MNSLFLTTRDSVPAPLPAAIASGARPASQLYGKFRADFGFDFHWLREGVGFVLQGDWGARMAAVTPARLAFRIRGACRLESAVTEEGGPRLVIRKSGEPLGVRVYCVADAPEDGQPDQLLTALAAGNVTASADARLLRRRIYTTAGDHLRTIEHGAGEFGEPTDTRSWDLKNQKGEKVASGVYVYYITTRLNAEETTGYFIVVR